MRWITNGGPGTVRRALAAVAVALLASLPARAQIVFDGNILYGNNDKVYPTGQFTGAATGGVAACPGKTALQIGTVAYVRNVYLAPLLRASYAAGRRSTTPCCLRSRISSLSRLQTGSCPGAPISASHR